MVKKPKSESLRDSFIKEIERLILSGKLAIGQKLLPERELAEKMKVSRIIVHNGLKELAIKGFVTIVPRQGTFVNDFIKGSTINILDSLTNYGGELSANIASNLLDFRYLLELESAKLAAMNRTDEDLKALGRIIIKEDIIDKGNTRGITDIDFEFHHTVAFCSKNIMFSSIVKTLEGLHKQYAYKFFEESQAYREVFSYHQELYEAIKNRSADEAVEIMSKVLKHGEQLSRELHII